MGLDIDAFSKLQPVTGFILDEDGYLSSDDYTQISEGIISGTEKHWPGRTEGLLPGVFSFEEEMSFRAGSYSGYNDWRNILAKLVGYVSAEDVWSKLDAKILNGGPFVELIYFSDCEGIIGPVVSAKLAKDFSDYTKRISDQVDNDSYFYKKYKEWKKAFELAGDNGYIGFH